MFLGSIKLGLGFLDFIKTRKREELSDPIVLFDKVLDNVENSFVYFCCKLWVWFIS